MHLSTLKGQAMTESVIVLTIAAILLMAITALAKYQFFAEQVAYAARWASWMEARMPATHSWQKPEVDATFFPENIQSWWAVPEHQVLAKTELQRRQEPLSAAANIGGTAVDPRILREDWGLEGRGVVTQQWQAAMQLLPPNTSTHLLQDSEKWNIPIQRAAYGLVGAGHASSAVDMQAAPNRSALGWKNATRPLEQATHSVASTVYPIDFAWRFSRPPADWLKIWTGYVPSVAQAPHE